MAVAGTGDKAFDTGDSELAEANFMGLAIQVLALLETRQKQVGVVMEHYEATNVAPEYQGKEHAWSTMCDDARTSIQGLMNTLVGNRGHAQTANQSADRYVQQMM